MRLNDSIINLQRSFFPIKSRDLVKNSNEFANFNIIIEAFLNLLLLSKNLKVRNIILTLFKVLRMLYSIIREPKTTFEPLLKRTLTIIAT